MKTYVQTITIANVNGSTITMAKKWKQPRCPSADKWTNNIWCIHATDNYWAIQRKEVLTHAAIQMNSENIVLSGRNKWHKRPHSVWFQSQEVSKTGQSMETGGGLMTARGWEGWRDCGRQLRVWGVFWGWCKYLGKEQWNTKVHNLVNILKNHWMVHF